MDNGTFSGPKYTGDHLTDCVNKAKCLEQDSIIYLYLIANVFKFYIKTSYIYNHSILFNTNSSLDASNLYNSQINKHRMTDLSNSKIDLIKASAQADFLNKSVKLDNDISNSLQLGGNIHRNKSSSINSGNAETLVCKRKRLITYYTNMANLSNLNNNITSSNNSDLCKSMYANAYTRPQLDIEFLRLILSNSSTSSVYSNFASSFNFDKSDMNIIRYLLRTLKIKQVYIYNLAMHKKKLKELMDELRRTDKSKSLSQSVKDHMLQQASGESTIKTENDNTFCAYGHLNKLNMLIKTEIQFPLLVEYEENSVFSSKKK